jgi:drug/metabolite transporter (DMT)-like permease
MPVLAFTFWQLIFASLPNLILAFLFESGELPGLAQSMWAVLYTGIFSIGIGYSLQAAGQRHAPAVDAALILCLEAVFAGIGGWLLLDESLTGLQLLGCFIILASASFVQVVGLKRGRSG